MNTLRKIEEKFNTNIKILYDEPMSEHTTFKVGGKAEAFIKPESVEVLGQLVSFLQTEKQRFFVLGGGSNLVVSDDGIDGAVICTRTAAARSARHAFAAVRRRCAYGRCCRVLRSKQHKRA